MRSIMFFSMLLLFSFAQAQTKSNDYFLFIGTYTNAEKTNGIHVYRFNPETGDFTSLSKVTDVSNPSYLAISRDRKHAYSVSEAGQGKGGVNAYSFDAKTGALTFINNAPSGGDGPCYVSVDDKKKFVFVGNYGGGTLSAIPVNTDGSLNSQIQTIRHEGSSVNKTRQDKPHVHAVVLSPDNSYLFVPDLGTDKVNIYKINLPGTQPLAPAAPAFASVSGGSGPRHFTFHPNKKFAYLIQELDASVTAFDYKNGKLTAKQTITMIAPGFTGIVSAADIHVPPDGKFLYASNRGDANEIVIYAIGKSGELTYAGRQSTLGKTPRNFSIDPTGNFLLAANQNSNTIIIFKRDKKSGMLTDTGKKIEIDKPVCLKFVPV